MRITLDFASPVLRDSELFACVARAAVECSIIVCRAHMRRFKTPPLYDSGIRYRLEAPGVEEFADCESMLQKGHGDCAHLVAYRCAELREAGELATVRIKWAPMPRNGGQRVFHVVVRRADGRIEDPSVRLGMHSGDAQTVERHPVRYKRL